MPCKIDNCYAKILVLVICDGAMVWPKAFSFYSNLPTFLYNVLGLGYLRSSTWMPRNPIYETATSWSEIQHKTNMHAQKSNQSDCRNQTCMQKFKWFKLRNPNPNLIAEIQTQIQKQPKFLKPQFSQKSTIESNSKENPKIRKQLEPNTLG